MHVEWNYKLLLFSLLGCLLASSPLVGANEVRCNELLDIVGHSVSGHPTVSISFGKSKLPREIYEDARKLSAHQLWLKHNLSTELQLELEKLTPTKVSRILKTISDINDLFHGKITLPESINIDIAHVRDNCSSCEATQTIHLAYQMESFESDENSPPKKTRFSAQDTRTADAHEYGHQIFSKNFSARFPHSKQWKKQEQVYFYRLGKAISKAIKAYDQQERTLSQQSPASDEVKAQIQRIQQFIDSLIGKLMGTKTQNKTESVKHNHTESRPLDIPYSELFADLVEVISQKTLTRSVLKKFDSKPSLSRITALKFKTPSSASEWTEKEEHDSLNPTRYFIWKEYLSKTPNQQKQVDILARVLKVITQEVAKRYTEQEYVLSPAEMNLRLIAALKRDMPK